MKQKVSKKNKRTKIKIKKIKLSSSKLSPTAIDIIRELLEEKSRDLYKNPVFDPIKWDCRLALREFNKAYPR